MWHSLSNGVTELLGLDLQARDLEFSHMAWRAVIVFFFAIFLARLGCRRFLGRNAAFDIMLTVILGSVISRAVNGQAAFFPTLGVSAVLVLLHRLLAFVAFRSHRISIAAKGRDLVLVRDGRIDWAMMSRAKVTEDDLREGIRTSANLDSLDNIASARLERSGEISVTKKPSTKSE
jgi:uncharacterized membrane protein YcaP (DUF421 family)